MTTGISGRVVLFLLAVTVVSGIGLVALCSGPDAGRRQDGLILPVAEICGTAFFLMCLVIGYRIIDALPNGGRTSRVPNASTDERSNGPQVAQYPWAIRGLVTCICFASACLAVHLRATESRGQTLLMADLVFLGLSVAALAETWMVRVRLESQRIVIRDRMGRSRVLTYQEIRAVKVAENFLVLLVLDGSTVKLYRATIDFERVLKCLRRQNRHLSIIE